MTGRRRIVGMTICALLAVSVLAWMILSHPDRQVPHDQVANQTGPNNPSPGSPFKGLLDTEVDAIKAFCQAKWAAPGEKSTCISNETAAAIEMNHFGPISTTLNDRCMKVAPNGYIAVMECVKAGEPKDETISQAPADPSHNYAMEEDGEYGYEGAISEDEQKAGRAAKPVIMVRYLGLKDGIYSIQIRSGQSAETMSCKAPCQFIKVKDTYAGQVMKTETVHTTGHAVMDAVFADAMNDQLKPYRSRQ
jgi:hypothetical protein